MKKRSKNRSKRSHIDYGASADKVVRTLYQAIRRDFEQSDILCTQSVDSYIRSTHLKSLHKKYIFQGDGENLDKLAYKKFLTVNEHLGKIELPSLPVRGSRSNSFLQNALLLAKRYVKEILGDSSWEEVFLQARHSGGASLGVSYSDTSLERKFSYPMTATESAARVFDSYLSFNHRLKESLDNSMDPHGLTMRYDIVSSSRATTVPKSNKIDRMIAIEPTVNMYLQQGIMQLMYNRLRKIGLDVEVLPDQHKVKAQLASITRKHATIDFSSASDCVSIDLLEKILPKSWFLMISEVRCSSISIFETEHRLNMISSMGNATTFPLETLVFYSLGLACCHLHSSMQYFGYFPYIDKFKNDLSVFGDDCIVPEYICESFIDITQKVGFIVNKSKSFYGANEPFRESCGGDYLYGTDVRPLFLQRPATSSKSAFEAWLYILFNNIRKMYIKYYGVNNYIYNKHAFRYLLKKITEQRKFILSVPPDFPIDSGILWYDVSRLQRCYPIRFNRIRIDEHGSRRFNFLKFQYWHKKPVSDDLRYFSRLKRMTPTWRKRSLFYHTRSKGGYVLARSLPYFRGGD